MMEIVTVKFNLLLCLIAPFVGALTPGANVQLHALHVSDDVIEDAGIPFATHSAICMASRTAAHNYSIA
jgi:hypothetical protein